MVGFFNGTATAMITPFAADGGVDFGAFGKMIDFQIENGTDALVILGTTGEPATMTEEEKEAVMRFSVQRAKGRAKIVFGSGSNCTAHAVEASKKAQALGADGLLVVTPYYNKCTQNGIVAYYEAVAGAVDIPVICYNVPPRTGVNILPATMERLAAIPNIAGVKEACGNMEQICETARRIRGKCDLYSGDDNLNLPILADGAAHPRQVRPVFGGRQPQPAHPRHRRGGADLGRLQHRAEGDQGAVQLRQGGRSGLGQRHPGQDAAPHRRHVHGSEPHPRQGGGRDDRPRRRRAPRTFDRARTRAQGAARARPARFRAERFRTITTRHPAPKRGVAAP